MKLADEGKVTHNFYSLIFVYLQREGNVTGLKIINTGQRFKCTIRRIFIILNCNILMMILN